MNALLSWWKTLTLVGCVVGFVVVTVALPYNDDEQETEEFEASSSTDTSAVTTHEEVQYEEVSPALVAALQQQYVFDTLSGDMRLRADTSVIANSEAVYSGRKISISICGVDSRMGERTEHADANHVLTVWLESGRMTLVSIPRDTPCDAGADNPRYNILANVRARKGRTAYLREVAAIAGLDTIEYYVDLGFSQARGILELLGFRGNSSDALKVLRSRHAFASGDYQRCYNQGQFIRQMLLKHFADVDGLTGSLLLRAALLLVNTNLTLDAIENIYQSLQQRGFPQNSNAIELSIQPAYYAKMAVFNFSDSSVLGALLHKVNKKALGTVSKGGTDVMVQLKEQLDKRIAKAIADSAHRPRRIVQLLQRPFEQRVWWQCSDASERAEVRKSIGTLLGDAYRKLGDTSKAERVRTVVEFEQQHQHW